MFIITLLIPAWTSLAQVQTPEPRDPQSAPRRIHTEVHVFIAEEFDEERDFEEYEQLYPVVHSTQSGGPQGTATGRVSYFTRCRFRPEDQAPAPQPLPSPSLALGAKMCPMVVGVKSKVTPLEGKLRDDPISTKPGLFGEEESGDDADSDRPVLCGPSLDLLLVRDVTGWEPAGWLPESTSLHLYASALFGRFEVFDVDSGLELYSAGLRLSIPLVRENPFSLGAAVSMGPGFMRTDIGEAVGFETGAGLRAELSIARGLSLLASVDANAFLSDGFTSWGPGANVGLNVAW